MKINELEKSKLEILIGKINEAVETAEFISGNAENLDFQAEIDVNKSDLICIVDELRKVNEKVVVKGY